ncbi:hypothetical protein BDW68DRAFT_192514 [Aspergillus falconensis]
MMTDMPKKGSVCLSTCKLKGQDATLRELAVTAPDSTRCWFSLLESAIVAAEPHTKLAAVEYPVLVDAGLVLMGYSTALVPAKRIDEKTILWHLEATDHDSQLKTTDLSALKGDCGRPRNSMTFETEKALLGCCLEAITLLGTDQLDTVQ